MYPRIYKYLHAFEQRVPVKTIQNVVKVSHHSLHLPKTWKFELECHNIDLFHNEEWT
jgi:hypothetical protein